MSFPLRRRGEESFEKKQQQTIFPREQTSANNSYESVNLQTISIPDVCFANAWLQTADQRIRAGANRSNLAIQQHRCPHLKASSHCPPSPQAEMTAE